jgi:hypothetical protein
MTIKSLLLSSIISEAWSIRLVLPALGFIFLFAGSYTYAQETRPIQRYIEREFIRNAAPNTGPAPDYSQLFYWASSPYKHDPGDSIPAFLTHEVRDSSVDVFFIHPTTYLDDANESNILDLTNHRGKLYEALKTASWNADLSNSAINKRTDSRPILFQATVFNGSCRIFAPRYRQANLKAFIIPGSQRSKQAFDLAYSDIKKAFQYYLDHDNHGRPIIIASHSQGSLHAIRLLQEFFDGKPLQQKLVCAYVIGYRIDTNAFKHIPVCNSPSATGCVIGWRSYQKGEIPYQVAKEKGNSFCVNPLTWTTATKWAPKELNLGSLISFNTLDPHSVGAGIEPATKILWVELPDNINRKIKKIKNLHVVDYNLFWMNIRENVRQRIAAYLK